MGEETEEAPRREVFGDRDRAIDRVAERDFKGAPWSRTARSAAATRQGEALSLTTTRL
jgi:hypothetical protein